MGLLWDNLISSSVFISNNCIYNWLIVHRNHQEWECQKSLKVIIELSDKQKAFAFRAINWSKCSSSIVNHPHDHILLRIININEITISTWDCDSNCKQISSSASDSQLNHLIFRSFY